MRVSPQLRRWLVGRGSDPSVRWRFLTEVERRPASDPRVQAAFQAIGRTGWAEQLLSHQFEDGHWVTAGSSGRELYQPKYIVSNWRAIVLADLGLNRRDPRIRRLAELILDRWKDDLSGPAAEICIAGNAARYLTRFGYLDHPSVQRSIDWIVRTQKSDGGWHCFRSRTGTLDSWEGLAALAELPESARDARVSGAIERAAEFYLRRRLMNEGNVRYPPWFRIHYPNHYYYDVLVGLRILTRLGYAGDRRLKPALRWLRDKQRPDGRWALDADHPDLDPEHGGYRVERVVYPLRLEPPNEASRWATVEALSVLERVERS